MYETIPLVGIWDLLMLVPFGCKASAARDTGLPAPPCAAADPPRCPRAKRRPAESPSTQTSSTRARNSSTLQPLLLLKPQRSKCPNRRSSTLQPLLLLNPQRSKCPNRKYLPKNPTFWVRWSLTVRIYCRDMECGLNYFSPWRKSGKGPSTVNLNSHFRTIPTHTMKI